MNPKTNLNLVRAMASSIDVEAVEREVDAMIGARVQAWAPSPTFGAHSCDEPALPLPDKVDRFVRRMEREFAAALDAARHALERATNAQAQVLARLTLDEARAIVEAETAADATTCANPSCGAVLVPSEGDRVVAGRCFACYEYRRRHGGDDASSSVIEARMSAA